MFLDEIDRQLLTLLQTDARRPLRALAEGVGASVASVGRRLARLRESGVIAREVAVLDPAKVGRPVTLIVQVQLESERLPDLAAFRKALQRERMVQQSFYVTGDTDFVLIVRAIDMAEYEALTGRLFLANPNVRRFTTLVAIGHAPIATAVPVGSGSG